MELATRNRKHAARSGRLSRSKKSGAFTGCVHFFWLLYQWKKFDASAVGEIRSWLEEQMKQDAVLVTLARALTGESWTTSLGMFGLGDRVSKRQVRVQISDDMELLDLAKFRAELERIVREKAVAPDDLMAVQTFLAAWDAKKNGRDD
jgi:hypothetical protein